MLYDLPVSSMFPPMLTYAETALSSWFIPHAIASLVDRSYVFSNLLKRDGANLPQ